ncbi:hypothetical protein NQ318_012605 [Aromia moschata]|uniref:NTF2 domain-containing protein n=1 Tax=Aromia moschata TaxID=1265417 RepID=A0AAV8YKB8_9CUCU|nr:hypothetical protein NQ318_012605 [Aromia moschata]
MNIMNTKPNSGAIILSEANLPSGVFYKNKALINNVNFWHKFIIMFILLDLIPVCFGKDDHTSGFLARNCGGAIEKLCKDNLTVPNPNGSRPFKLTVILKFSTTSEFKIDVQKNITSVLLKRFDVTTKTLDLSNFHEDPDLSEFCPLSQPKIMFFVLHLSKNTLAERYILCNNLIKVINPLEALGGVKVNYIDLRDNLIVNPEDIAYLRVFNLTDILLDGNPVCEKLDQNTYIETIKKILQAHRENRWSFTKRRKYANNKNKFSMQYRRNIFFTAYDLGNRGLLEPLYHRNALFSLTSEYLDGQLSSPNAHMRPYNNVSRNLLKVADFSRNSEFLFRGSLQIMKLFSQLPPTEHDPYSFKVDLIYSTTFCAIICVTGVFRELPNNLLDPERLLGFTRTFVIEILNKDGECCITNEQLHLYNALSTQVASSFKISKPLQSSGIPHLPNSKEQQQLADTLKIITNLTTDWSRKCVTILPDKRIRKTSICCDTAIIYYYSSVLKIFQECEMEV